MNVPVRAAVGGEVVRAKPLEGRLGMERVSPPVRGSIASPMGVCGLACTASALDEGDAACCTDSDACRAEEGRLPARGGWAEAGEEGERRRKGDEMRGDVGVFTRW